MITITRIPSDTGYHFAVSLLTPDGLTTVECGLHANDTLASGDGRHVIAAAFAKLEEGLECLGAIAPGSTVKLGEYQAEKKRHAPADVPAETHPEITDAPPVTA